MKKILGVLLLLAMFTSCSTMYQQEQWDDMKPSDKRNTILQLTASALFIGGITVYLVAVNNEEF